MNDQDTKYLVRRRRLLNQMRRLNHQQEHRQSASDNQTFEAGWIGQDSASGRAFLRNKDGSIYRASQVITNGQILPGQRIMGLRSPEGFATANQMPAPSPQVSPITNKKPTTESPRTLYLVELVYETVPPVPCSCKPEKLGALVLFTRAMKATWRGGGACPVVPPRPAPGPPPPPPPLFILFPPLPPVPKHPAVNPVIRTWMCFINKRRNGNKKFIFR